MFIVDKDILKHRVASYTAKVVDNMLMFHAKTICGIYVKNLELQTSPRCQPDNFCEDCLSAFIK